MESFTHLLNPNISTIKLFVCIVLPSGKHELMNGSLISNYACTTGTTNGCIDDCYTHAAFNPMFDAFSAILSLYPATAAATPSENNTRARKVQGSTVMPMVGTNRFEPTVHHSVQIETGRAHCTD